MADAPVGRHALGVAEFVKPKRLQPIDRHFFLAIPFVWVAMHRQDYRHGTLPSSFGEAPSLGTPHPWFPCPGPPDGGKSEIPSVKPERRQPERQAIADAGSIMKESIAGGG